MRQASKSVCPLQWNDNKNNSQKPISKVCVTTSLTIEDLLHNMGCFDTSESGNISYSSEVWSLNYTTPAGLLCQCYQRDVAQVTPKQHSINVSVSSQRGKTTYVWCWAQSVTIFQIKPPHLFFPFIKVCRWINYWNATRTKMSRPRQGCENVVWISGTQGKGNRHPSSCSEKSSSVVAWPTRVTFQCEHKHSCVWLLKETCIMNKQTNKYIKTRHETTNGLLW